MALKLAARALLLATWATAQDSPHEGCIHMQIVHSTNRKAFGKRAVQFELANRSDVAYYAKIQIGTPPQPQFVQLDTGSFELWVNPTCSSLSSGDESFCNSVGQFDTSKSSTFNNLTTSKTLKYGIGVANISYVTDDITLPGSVSPGSTSTLRQVQFGVAMSSQEEFSGILGIGYGMGKTTRYPNFVDALSIQNATRVKAFTLALGSKDEQEGVIVFGGVDTSKYQGTMARLPIIPADQSPDGVPRYWVQMLNMSVELPAQGRKTYTNSSMPVFLDSGSTLTLLPPTLVASIASDFGAVGPDSSGLYSVDCSIAKANGTLDFAFSGVTIRVPYHELIRQSGSGCVLGLQGNTQFVLLGDTFLRSAYVVFDLETNSVYMSQYLNCGSTPAALGSVSSLATLQGTCTPQRAVSDSASRPAGDGTEAGTTTATGTATAGAPPQSASASGLGSGSGRAVGPVPLLLLSTLAASLAVWAM